MHWNDWPIICWTFSTLLCLLGRRWIDTFSSACFAVFMIFDRILPTMALRQLKWIFFVIGVIVIASQIAKAYRKYKEGLTAA
jgi:uncharacterized membrane protein YhaH (DUF805 family)